MILGERGQALSPLTPCVYLSLPQAPEHLLPHMAELKKELLALRAQLGYKSQALASLQQRQGTDVQGELSPGGQGDDPQPAAPSQGLRGAPSWHTSRPEGWQDHGILQHSSAPPPSHNSSGPHQCLFPPVLLQALRDHDREQAGALGPRIQLVTEQCERRIERWPEVQATIDAW